MGVWSGPGKDDLEIPERTLLDKRSYLYGEKRDPKGSIKLFLCPRVVEPDLNTHTLNRERVDQAKELC